MRTDTPGVGEAVDGVDARTNHVLTAKTEPSRKERRTQSERSEATTRLLVSEARELFARKGFAATSIEEIARAAGMTRGALYHHFPSKEALFEAVLQHEQRRIVEKVRSNVAGTKGAWKQVSAGCDEFLSACLDPATQQIMLIDGPSVLGDRRMDEIRASSWLVVLERTLQKAVAEGTLSKRPSGPLAHLLFGALCQGARAAARSDDPQGAMRDVRREVRRLLAAIERS